MHNTDLISNPRFTFQLVRDGVFRDQPFVFVDVGMRGGIPGHMAAFGEQMQVVGFEPDADECRRLNTVKTEWLQRCYPVALDSIPRRRTLMRRAHNAAADGLYPNTWWAPRFGAGSIDDWTATALDEIIKPRSCEKSESGDEFVTTTYSRFADENGLPSPDFMKVDVEGGELDVLIGAEKFLSPDGILAIEAEVRYAPIQNCPLFLDTYGYLAKRGYFLYSMSPFRCSRRFLPMPVAWDHLDHNGNPILGPTTRGQYVHGDAFFARDLISDGFKPNSTTDCARVLKAAAIMELYNLPDCAAELLWYYRRDLVEHNIKVSDLLDQLVPEALNLRYPDYLALYREKIGRM